MPRPDDQRRDERLADLGAEFAAKPYARRGVPASQHAIRVVLTDDHEMVREGLRLLLGRERDITVLGEAASGVEALALVREKQPDILVLDLDMADHGEDVLRELREAESPVRILILTMYPEQDRLVALLESGAHGYVSKRAAAERLVEAIRVVAAGEVYVVPSAARMLAAAVAPTSKSRTATSQYKELSARERSVLRMIAEGYSGVETARSLRVSTKTVAAYKERVEEKLGLKHRTDYVRFALDAGVLPGGGRTQ